MTKPNWKPQKIKLGQIQAWDNNPRMSTKAQAQRIIASERKFGQPVPFLVAPEVDGRFLLYDGHQRLAAWFTVYGADYEMDAMVADRPLTEAEHKELIITLHTGATGSWDWNALSGWSAGDLQEWGMNGDALKSWNNDANNLKELLTAEVEPVDAEPQTDRAGELAEKWATASGQLWKLGDHRLLIGDCTDDENYKRLVNGEIPDFAFTDPPYNVGVKYTEATNDNQTKNGFIEWCKGWTKNLPKRHVLTVGIKRLVWWDDILGDPQWIIAWVKRNGQGQTGLGGTNKWDAIICYGVGQDHKTDMIELNNDYSEGVKAEGGHPTAKPVELWKQVIERFDGKLIYEPFGGSGTTILASQSLNRRCYAMEISEKYGAVILQRFLDATGVQPELVE